MKRILVAAATCAIGALGTAGLMSAAPASAAPTDCSSFQVLQGKYVCNVVTSTIASALIFAETANPVSQTNVNTFLHGTTDADGNNDGLGILDQPKTFVDSVKSFLTSGPTIGG
jgi:hypothetical protein